MLFTVYCSFALSVKTNEQFVMNICNTATRNSIINILNSFSIINPQEWKKIPLLIIICKTMRFRNQEVNTNLDWIIFIILVAVLIFIIILLQIY